LYEDVYQIIGMIIPKILIELLAPVKRFDANIRLQAMARKSL